MPPSSGQRGLDSDLEAALPQDHFLPFAPPSTPGFPSSSVVGFFLTCFLFFRRNLCPVRPHCPFPPRTPRTPASLLGGCGRHGRAAHPPA